MSYGVYSYGYMANIFPDDGYLQDPMGGIDKTIDYFDPMLLASSGEVVGPRRGSKLAYLDEVIDCPFREPSEAKSTMIAKFNPPDVPPLSYPHEGCSGCGPNEGLYRIKIMGEFGPWQCDCGWSE